MNVLLLLFINFIITATIVEGGLVFVSLNTMSGRYVQVMKMGNANNYNLHDNISVMLHIDVMISDSGVIENCGYIVEVLICYIIAIVTSK